MQECIERIARLETKVSHIETRTEAINAKFAPVTRMIEDRTPGPKMLVPLFVAILGMVGGWIYTLAQKPDRAEVIEAVHERSPYMKDKDSVRRVIDTYDSDVKEIRDGLGEIRVEQRSISVKLDNLIEQNSRR